MTDGTEISTAATIRVRVGQMEFIASGTEQFLEEAAVGLIERLLAAAGSVVGAANLAKPPTSAERLAGSGTASLEATTNTLAVKLGARSGPELALAAVAQLSFAQGKDVFTRKEILEQMQTATSFYTSSHRKNLSAILNSLLKERKIIERTTDTFALEASAREELLQRVS